MKDKAKNYRGNKSVIVVAGEGNYDRQVIWHLIRAFRPDAKIVNIRDKTALREADKELTPRIDKLRRLAQAASVRSELAGIVVHVDLDDVNKDTYSEVRKRISTELRKTFSCPSAVALAAFETEAWLMQFPSAFAKVNASWVLKEKYRGCDLSKVDYPKERLKEHPWKPRYSESEAPRIMEKAFDQDGKLIQPDGKNYSYEEFITELAGW
ncbi:hypothetical protein [Streptomyces sp. NPDC019937]|uniref:hypothetical protein n=1 Tax=Streptomyces sp. NPDC019937 TaxID=3154787 RepID=UPI0033D45AD7